jgi:hypothetical protein
VEEVEKEEVGKQRVKFGSEFNRVRTEEMMKEEEKIIKYK